MINFKIKNDNFFEVEIDGRQTEIYPRVFQSIAVTLQKVKIYTKQYERVLFNGISYLDFSVNNVVGTSAVDSMNLLNEVLYNNASSSGASAVYVTSTIPMKTTTGELVFLQTLSNGTTKYTNPDGTPYTGNTTTLLPYSNNTQESIVIPLIDGTNGVDNGNGTFTYTILQSVHNKQLISNVEFSETINGVYSDLSGYTFGSGNSLLINSNASMSGTFVRITGANL